MVYEAFIDSKKHDEKNKFYLLGRDDGHERYVCTEVEDSQIETIRRACATIFECQKFWLLEASESEEALKYANTQWPMETMRPDVKYPLEELHRIRWDVYDSYHKPQEYCDKVEALGGKILIWDPVPVADCILILFHLKGDLPQLPIAENGENFEHHVFAKENIKEAFPQFIKEQKGEKYFVNDKEVTPTEPKSIQGRKYFVNDKEVTFAELKNIQENLFIGNEEDGYCEVLEIDEITDEAMYFNVCEVSYY